MFKSYKLWLMVIFLIITIVHWCLTTSKKEELIISIITQLKQFISSYTKEIQNFSLSSSNTNADGDNVKKCYLSKNLIKEKHHKQHLHQNKKEIRKIVKFVEEVCRQYPEFSQETAYELFPRKYEQHDHVLVIRLPNDVALSKVTKVAKIIAKSFEPIKISVILLDKNGIHGELRKPELSLLFEDKEQARVTESLYEKRLLKKLSNKSQEYNCNNVIALEKESYEYNRELESIIKKHCLSLTFALHIENGIHYYFDVIKVMFCSGNTTERMHFATIIANNEVVVDMFAGIGYFTIPLAKYGNIQKIYALEKNDESVEFLKINLIANNIREVVKVIQGDNREIADDLRGKCDRVIMGYIPSCESFIPRAISFLKMKQIKNYCEETVNEVEEQNDQLITVSTSEVCNKPKNKKNVKLEEQRPKPGEENNIYPCGILHYHYLAPKHEALTTVHSHLTNCIESYWSVKITQIRCVKSYAPQLYHFVADIHFGYENNSAIITNSAQYETHVSDNAHIHYVEHDKVK